MTLDETLGALLARLQRKGLARWEVGRDTYFLCNGGLHKSRKFQAICSIERLFVPKYHVADYSKHKLQALSNHSYGTRHFWFPKMTASGVLLQLVVAPTGVSDLKCTQMHREMGIPSDQFRKGNRTGKRGSTTHQINKLRCSRPQK